MFRLDKKIKIALYIVCLCALFAPVAQAYVDPGTGSYIFQIIIASFLGSLFFIKRTWRAFKLFVREKFLPKKTQAPEIIIQDNDHE